MASLPELPYKRKDHETRLGDLVESFMEGVVKPKKNKLAPIIHVWSQCVPPQCAGHCRVTGLNGSQLQVNVDTPAYLYTLQMGGKELIAELMRLCPGAGVKTIKFTLG